MVYVGGPSNNDIQPSSGVWCTRTAWARGRAISPRRSLLARGRQTVGEFGVGDFFSVWDTNTGELLKTCDKHVEFAFCPTRPVLGHCGEETVQTALASGSGTSPG